MLKSKGASAMNTLYCLPLGETMRDKFIEDARQYAYGEALFVVPGYYFSQLVKSRAGVKTVIMDYLPNEILRLYAEGKAYQRISRLAQEMLLKSIVKDMLAQGELTYFAPLADRDGFVKNLAVLIGELSRSYVDTEELSGAFDHWDGRKARLQEKDRELNSIYATYRARLAAANLYDVDGLYRLAISLLEKGEGKLHWQKLYFSEFYQFDDLQRALLKVLSKHCDIQIGIFYDGQRPDVSEATLNAYGDISGMNFQVVKEEPTVERNADLAYLVENWHRPGHTKTEAHNITLLATTSPENEMAAVITSIKNLLRSGVNPEEIVVLVRSLTDYAGFSDLFRAYGVPTVLPQVANFSGQALPDFLGKLLQVALNTNNVEKWQALLATDYCQVLYNIPRENLEEEYNANFFPTSKKLLSFLQDFYPEAKTMELEALSGNLAKKHTGSEYAEILSEALDGWQISIRAGKAYQQDRITLSQLKILTGCEKICHSVLEAIELAFAQNQKSGTITLEDFITLWRDQSKDAIITLDRGQHKGIQVLEVANVQGVTFPHVFLMGLREGMFPKIKFENWLYNDKERAMLHALDINLQQTSANVAMDRYFFGAALAMATEKLHLSYYVDDAAGASGYIEELAQYFQSGTWQKEGFVVTVDNCAGKQELVNILARAGQTGAKETQWLTAQLGENFPLQKALDEERWLKANSYNGQVAGQGELPALSASSLDLYVKCPFSYLVAKEWKTGVWEPLTEEIQPTVSGDLYHLILAKFLGRHLQENISTLDKGKLAAELRTAFNEEYKIMVEKGIITETPLGTEEKKFYWRVLCKWLEREISYQAEINTPLLPKELEIGFGLKDSKWPALQLTIDNKVTAFSGQIDRIDTDGKNYIITDYKSGSFPNGADIAKGYALQLPLYVLALTNLCHLNMENVWGAGYYALKEGRRKSGMWNKEQGKDLPWLNTGRNQDFETVMDTAKGHIAQCVRAIRRGEFPAAPQKNCPVYCPGYDVCRYKLNTTLNLSEEGDGNE